MVTPMGGRPAECTITGYCDTSVYDFPGSYLVAEEPIDCQIIYSLDGLKAAIVSDLPAYFEQIPDESLHYAIDVSLRAGVRSTYEKAIERSNRKSRSEAPLFLVIEERAEVPATVLNSGECFTIDEFLDSKAMIEGGRQGERALLAVSTTDGSWPDFHANMHMVNVVLAAVKAEQDFTRHIEKLYSCSCFVTSEGQAVYTLRPSMSAAISKRSRLEPPILKEKVIRIRSMLQGMMADSEPIVSELFDSIVLDKTKGDSYLRLWYLRLWQALVDAGRHLGIRN